MNYNAQSLNSTRRSLHNEKLEFYKKEIYWVYMKENNTLQTTMSMMGEKYGFMARWVDNHVFKVVYGLTTIYSERKWKMKLKEWEFRKYTTKKLTKAVEMTSSRDGK